MNQRTPFDTIELGKKEFNKIFTEKTSNKFGEEFARADKKYNLTKLKEIDFNYKELLTNFDWANHPRAMWTARFRSLWRVSLTPGTSERTWLMLVSTSNCCLFLKLMSHVLLRHAPCSTRFLRASWKTTSYPRMVSAAVTTLKNWKQWKKFIPCQIATTNSCPLQQLPMF